MDQWFPNIFDHVPAVLQFPWEADSEMEMSVQIV